MKVLKVVPEKSPYVVEIENSLESLQKEVGGYIECVYPFSEDVGIICNDEGKLMHYTPNRVLRDDNGTPYDIVFGDFLIVGLTEDDFGDLSEKQISKYSKYFNDTIELMVTYSKIKIKTTHEDGSYDIEELI